MGRKAFSENYNGSLLRMKYPQSLFASKINARISPETRYIIDAPCGRGETTFSIALGFPKAKVVGVDIDKSVIKSALKHYSRPNLEFFQRDIYTLISQQETVDVFCLINSLFLLPEPKALLRKISEKLELSGRLLLVLPNPQSQNFKRFQKLSPEVNGFILERHEYEDFFKSADLKVLACEAVAKIPTYGRWDTKVLYFIRDRYLFWLEDRSNSRDYGYYLVELVRDE